MIHRLYHFATFFPSVDIADLSDTIAVALDFQESRSNFRKMLNLARKMLRIEGRAVRLCAIVRYILV